MKCPKCGIEVKPIIAAGVAIKVCGLITEYDIFITDLPRAECPTDQWQSGYLAALEERIEAIAGEG